MLGGFTGVAVLEAGPAESFQGARFLWESAEIACEGAMLETCGSAGRGCTFPVTVSSLKQ